VVDFAAGQPHPLGQADQAGAGAAAVERPLVHAGGPERGGCDLGGADRISQLDQQAVAGTAVEQQPGRTAGRVLAGVGQTLLHDPVGGPAEGVRQLRGPR